MPLRDVLVSSPTFPYDLRRKAGEGAMGVVYEAFDRDLGRPVAIKVMRDDLLTSLSPEGQREARLRFQQEARAAARLSHPGTGEVIATPMYASPEQLRGVPVDGRSDIFGAGVVLYQCLTGTLPSFGKSLAEAPFLLSPFPASPAVATTVSGEGRVVLTGLPAGASRAVCRLSGSPIASSSSSATAGSSARSTPSPVTKGTASSNRFPPSPPPSG